MSGPGRGKERTTARAVRERELVQDFVVAPTKREERREIKIKII